MVSDANSDVWPSGVATTLWNYNTLLPGQRPVLPFAGFTPDWHFMLAFAFGVAVIVLFAYQRFRKRTFEPASTDYRVLRDLAPTQLLGTRRIRYAYYFYAGVLVGGYTALTFFGGVLFAAVNAIPMAGLQVDIDKLPLGSAQWPLTLAFALAGFTSLLPPLEIAETWLRQQAHRLVGIPVKTKELTQVLLKSLKEFVHAELTDGLELHVEGKKLPAWVISHINKTDDVLRVLNILSQLEFLLKLFRDESSWPKVKIRDELRKLEDEEITKAEIALQDFLEIIRANYRASPSFIPKGGAVRGDMLTKHRRTLETKLTAAIERMDQGLSELVAILTVYAERDRDYYLIENDLLKSALVNTFALDQKRNKIDAWVLLLAVPVFAIYAVTTSFGFHDLLKFGVDRSFLTVSATAVMETLRFATVFWLPLVVVLLVRHKMKLMKQWHPFQLKRFSRWTAGLMIAMVSLTAAVASIGLSLLSFLWSATIADNPARFWEILLGGSVPFLTFFASQALISVPFVFVVVWVADKLEAPGGAEALPSKRYGVLAGAITLLATVIHYVYWSAASCATSSCQNNTRSASAIDALRKGINFAYQNTTDLVICVLVSFLTAAVFARPLNPLADGGKPPLDPLPTVAIKGLLLFGAFLFFFPMTSASASDIGNSKTIVAGFRSDAEPFSYRSEDSTSTHFEGYTAQICYDIFSGSPYRFVQQEVSASDRFKRLRKETDREDDPQKIDILCDPTTLRFTPDIVSADGVFSPIVFVSGVSYLFRPTRQLKKDAYLAFVEGTTARKVAVQACKVDLLGVRPKQPGNCEIARNQQCEPGRIPPEPKYWFCIFKNHTQLIEWFCERPSEDRQLAYFGDREIIHSKLDAWSRQHGCAGGIEREQKYFTYEPYALLVSKKDPALIQFVQRRVYEIFSNRPRANSLFTNSFPDTQMSPTVANLFLLNAVEEEGKYRSSVLPMSMKFGDRR